MHSVISVLRQAHTVFFTLGKVVLVSLSCYLGVFLQYENIFEISTSLPNLAKIGQWIQKLLDR